MYWCTSYKGHIITIMINACTNMTSESILESILHPYRQFSENYQFAFWDWDWEEGLNSDREGGCIGAPPIRGRQNKVQAGAVSEGQKEAIGARLWTPSLPLDICSQTSTSSSMSLSPRSLP